MASTSFAAPIASVFAFLTIYTYSILEIPPKSILRYVSSLAILGSAYALQRSLDGCFESRSIQATSSAYGWVFSMSALELLLYSKAGPRDMPKTMSKDEKPSEPSRIGAAYWAIMLLANFRRIGTKWQVKNIPPCPSDVPSRREFLRQKLTSIVIIYVVLDILSSGPPPDRKVVGIRNQALLLRTSELTSDELIFRVISVAVYWINTYLFNLFMVEVAIFVSVLTGIITPDECNPLYGPIKEAWSIRQFWGVSWHQIFRRSIQGISDIVADALFIPRGTLLSRYFRLTVSFAISGLIHFSADMSMNIPLAEAGAMTFFLAQPLGIMVEDYVQHVYKQQGFRFLRGYEYLIGYAWLMAFQLWITPTWFYPPIRYMNPAKDGLIPFHIGSLVSAAFR